MIFLKFFIYKLVLETHDDGTHSLVLEGGELKKDLKMDSIFLFLNITLIQRLSAKQFIALPTSILP